MPSGAVASHPRQAPFSLLSHLECSRCGRQHEADRVQNCCPCGSPLLARYDLAAVGATTSPAGLASRPPTLWRYHELLPVRHASQVITLGEGMTPLVELPSYGASIGVPRLLRKDEGALPTGSFKARGAAVGVSRAAELGVRGVRMPTNGNAGAAWAAYAARAGLSALIAMPAAAPAVAYGQALALGAEVHRVDGHIGDAGQLVTALAAERPGEWMDASTLREPYRVEGKKTMGLEIAEQLGWRLPDVVVYPTGGGVGLIGIHKALLEARELGWVSGPLPRLVAVQAAGCAPIVAAFEAGQTESRPWPDPQTVAFGMTVPKALGDFLVLEAVRDTAGCAVAVTDEDLLRERDRCAALEGALVCPEGGAALAAVRLLRERGWLSRTERVVVLDTGNALLYPETLPRPS